LTSNYSFDISNVEIHRSQSKVRKKHLPVILGLSMKTSLIQKMGIYLLRKLICKPRKIWPNCLIHFSSLSRIIKVPSCYTDYGIFTFLFLHPPKSLDLRYFFYKEDAYDFSEIKKQTLYIPSVLYEGNSVCYMCLLRPATWWNNNTCDIRASFGTEEFKYTHNW
jgi:hypothetical protein